MLSSSSRLLFKKQRIVTGSVLVSRQRSQPLKLCPSNNAVNFSTTRSNTIGGFFNRNKPLLKRGAAYGLLGLGIGHTAYKMQRNKAEWQNGAKTMLRMGHPIHTATIEEHLAHMDHQKTLDEKDLTWYDIVKTFCTSYYSLAKLVLESNDWKPDPQAVQSLKELTFEELKEKLKQGYVVKIVMYVGDTDLAYIECQMRGDESSTLKFHMKMDDSWTTGYRFLDLAGAQLPDGIFNTCWETSTFAQEQAASTIILVPSNDTP